MISLNPDPHCGKTCSFLLYTQRCVLSLLPLDSDILSSTPQRVLLEGEEPLRNCSMSGAGDWRSLTAKGMT